MASFGESSRQLPLRATFPPAVQFVCQAILLGAFLSLAPWLAVRRLANIGETEGAANPLITSLVLTAVGLCLRRLLTPAFVRPFAGSNCPRRPLRIVLAIAVGVSVGVAVLAISQWGTERWISLVGIALYLFTEALIWRFPQGVEIIPWRESARPECTNGPNQNGVTRAVALHEMADDSEEEPEIALPAGVQQKITRAQTEEGETALVLQRLSWRVGERTQVVHVAFCPPLSAVPELHMETAEGEEVELRSTLTEPFGLRIEAKRFGGSTPSAESLLAIHALAPVAHAPAE